MALRAVVSDLDPDRLHAPGLTVAPLRSVESVRSETDPDVLVLGPAPGQLALAQRLHAACPASGMVVVVAPGDPAGVRRAATYTPGIPADLVLVEEPVTDLAAVAAGAAQDAVRRREHAAMLARLAEQPPEAPPALRRLSRPLSTMLDHAPLGVLVVDPAGTLLSWNAQASTMVGLGTGHAGRRLADFFSAPAAVSDAVSWAARMEEAAPAVPVTPIGAPHVTLELNAVDTRLDDERPAVLVLLVDVSLRHAAEAARDELNGRLQVAQRSEEFLLRASDVLAAASGYEEALDQLAEVAVPMLGDLCLIDVVEDGGMRRLAARHADPARQGVADELRARFPRWSDAGHPSVTAARTRRTHWDAQVSPEWLREHSLDEQHFQLLTEIGVSGYVAVPLVADDEVLGSVTLVTCGTGRRFTADDVAIADALAGRVAQVVAKARRYDREHRIAEALQRSMLTALPTFPGLDLQARYVPAREYTQVGGDWYDAFAFPGASPVVVIGDVVGHDLEAAARMGQLRNAVRALAWGRSERPAEVLEALDELNDGLAIAELTSVLYAVLERPDVADAGAGVVLRWSNAGHLPPLVVQPDGSAAYLDAVSDVVVGVPSAGRRTEGRAPVPAGATILLFTDGLVERRHESLDVGLERLASAASALAGEPVSRVADGVVDALAKDAEDDVALLVIRVGERAR